MGFKEDRHVDKNQESYPMANRYKKTAHGQARKATELNLSNFVRDKKLENRKRNILRTHNRINKYKTTLTLLEDDDFPVPSAAMGSGASSSTSGAVGEGVGGIVATPKKRGRPPLPSSTITTPPQTVSTPNSTSASPSSSSSPLSIHTHASGYGSGSKGSGGNSSSGMNSSFLTPHSKRDSLDTSSDTSDDDNDDRDQSICTTDRYTTQPANSPSTLSAASLNRVTSPDLLRNASSPSGRHIIPMSPARMPRSTHLNQQQQKQQSSTGTQKGYTQDQSRLEGSQGIGNGDGRSELTPSIASRSSAFASYLPSGLLSPSPLQTSSHVATSQTSLQKRSTTDAVSHAIFQALFGLSSSRASRLTSHHFLDESESEDEDDDGDVDLYHIRTIDPVDESWFNKLVSTSLLSTKALQYALQKNIPADTSLPPNELLSEYLQQSFLTSLLDQLPFEDERVSSPRVSVLKAVCRNCACLRQFLADGLKQVSYLRLLRCKSSSRFAVHFEIDPNAASSIIADNYDYLSREHMLDTTLLPDNTLVTYNILTNPTKDSSVRHGLAAFTNPSTALNTLHHTLPCTATWVKHTSTVTTNGCGVEGDSRSGGNKKTLLFPSMRCAAIPSASPDSSSAHHGAGSSSSGSSVSMSGVGKVMCKDGGNSGNVVNEGKVGIPPIRDHDSSIVEVTVFMILTCFEPPIQSTGLTSPDHGTLSNTDTGEPTITPAGGQLKLYQTLLAVLVNVLRCYGRRLGKTTEGVEQPVVLRGILKGLELLFVRAPVEVSGTVLDDLILPALLHAWPGGGNSTREVAFLKAVGLLLTHSNSPPPPPAVPPRQTNPQSSSPTHPSPSDSNCVSIPNLLYSFPKTPTRFKCLFNIVKCITSVHFKVCLQAISIILSPNCLQLVLGKDVSRILLNKAQGGQYGYGSGGSDVYHSDEDEDMNDDGNGAHRARLLESVVEALRKNRSHWNVAVKEASQSGLDRILDLM